MSDDFEIDAEYIAEKLGGKRSGKGYRCVCPACGSKSDAFVVSTGKNGRPIFHCYAGCDFATVREVLMNEGLWPECSKKTKDPALLDKLRTGGVHAQAVEMMLTQQLRRDNVQLSDEDINTIRNARCVLHKLRTHEAYCKREYENEL